MKVYKLNRDVVEYAGEHWFEILAFMLPWTQILKGSKALLPRIGHNNLNMFYMINGGSKSYNLEGLRQNTLTPRYTYKTKEIVAREYDV